METTHYDDVASVIFPGPHAPVLNVSVSSPTSFNVTDMESSLLGDKPQTSELEPTVMTAGLRGNKKTRGRMTSEAKRARRSEIERKSRQRRNGTLQLMHEELKKLEKHYELLTKENGIQASVGTRGVILHPSAIKELRARYLQLSAEATALRNEQKHLQRILHQNQLFHDSYKSLAMEFANGNAYKWEAVEHASFTPKSAEEYFEIMRDSCQIISRFDSDRNLISTGAKFFGWSDKRRLDDETASMHFTFTKSFANQNSERLLEESWRTYSDQEFMQRVIFTSAVKVKLEILYVINADACVVRRHTKYLAMGKSFHTVYLLFRLQTDEGYTLIFRTIPAPEIQNAIDGNEAWIDIFHWTHLKRIYDENGYQTGTEISFGGSINGPVMKFAMHWMLELVMIVVRWENAIVAPLFIMGS